jgi:hypothetical protein
MRLRKKEFEGFTGKPLEVWKELQANFQEPLGKLDRASIIKALRSFLLIFLQFPNSISIWDSSISR